MARQRDDFRDAATATTGATMLATGGVLRHTGVKRGFGPDPKKQPKVHALGMLKAPAGKKLFYGGSALGLTGLAPLAVGTSNLARRDVNKADEPKRRKFWREGLKGSAGALGQRADSLRQDVPMGARGTQFGVAAGAGFGGSALARAALKTRPGLKPGLAPVAGALAATATVPASSKIINRRYPGYEVTATGVRRQKKAPKPLSSARSMYRPTPRSFQADLAKADSYLGARTNRGVQRAAVTAAGHPPIVGPLTAAAAAGKYAPPGQERKHAARQWALGSGAGVVTGTAAAYGGAKLGDRSPKFAERAEGALRRVEGVENRARRAVGMGEKTRDFSKPPTKGVLGRVAGTKAGKPLFKSPGAAAGATAAFLGVKAATGAVGGQTAITLNQRDQSRYNKAKGIVGKKDVSKPEKQSLARKKRVSSLLSGVGGTAGLTGVALLAAGKKGPATSAGIIGGGFGGANALLNVPIQRKEAQVLAPVKKGAGVVHIDLSKAATGMSKDVLRYVGADGTRMRVRRPLNEGTKAMLERKSHPAYRRAIEMAEDPLTQTGTVGPVPKQIAQARTVRTGLKRRSPGAQGQKWDIPTTRSVNGPRFERMAKADALEPRYDKTIHQARLKQYGDRGPLPKGLDRRTRAQAYEARYLHHGGNKANKYKRRGEVGEGVKNIGLGVATVGGAAYLGAKTKRGAKLAAKIPNARRRADNVAIAGGVAGGAGEIYSGYANQRQSSYANTPGGVAASSLRRMRAYDPDGD